jgi:predicted O-methyltransferase YrrM
MQHPRLGMCSPPDSIPILQMLARLTDAKLIVEVGVFTGYATLGMALALPPDGQLIACDVSRDYTSVGEAVLGRCVCIHVVPLITSTLQRFLVVHSRATRACAC